MQQALMPLDLYQQLQACREEMARNGVAGWKHDSIANLAAVFVPVRPRPDAAAPFTVLCVGQATRGYCPEYEPALRTYAGSVARTVEIASTHISGAAVSGAAPFWRWVRHTLTLALALRQLGHAATTDDLLGCLAWSNLAKIGDTKGNPPAWTMAGQAALAARSLRYEIRTMRPTLVVVCAGKFAITRARPVFEAVFGPTAWDGDSIEIGSWENVPVLFEVAPIRRTV